MDPNSDPAGLMGMLFEDPANRPVAAELALLPKIEEEDLGESLKSKDGC